MLDSHFSLVSVITVYAWVGWLVTTLVLGVLYVATGVLGVRVYRRLARVYHMTVVTYWLGRLEKEGVRVFQRAQEEDKARIASRAGKAWDQPL